MDNPKAEPPPVPQDSRTRQKRLCEDIFHREESHAAFRTWIHCRRDPPHVQPAVSNQNGKTNLGYLRCATNLWPCRLACLAFCGLALRVVTFVEDLGVKQKQNFGNF